jgi:NADH dehydrogenase
MILVSGASGFVGRHVTRDLVARGLRVRAMVRSASGAATLDGVDCELVSGDVSDPASLRAASRGMRTIVHLVSIVEGSPSTFERVMAAGTGNLVEAARESGVRRIVLMSALGTGPEATVPYFRAKWAAEQAVASSGVEHVVLRPSFVFGTDGGALPRFLRIARLAPVTPVIGPGTQRVQPIWITDLVRAVALAVEAEGTSAPVELGGPEPVTWSDLWHRLKLALGTRRPAVHVPFWLARGPAALFERIPPALLTRDQLRMLEGPDNVVTDSGASMRRLGLGELVPLDEQLRRAVAAPAGAARTAGR